MIRKNIYILATLSLLSGVMSAMSVDIQCKHERYRTKYSTVTQECEVPPKTVIVVQEDPTYYDEVYLGPERFFTPVHPVRGPYVRAGRVHGWGFYR